MRILITILVLLFSISNIYAVSSDCIVLFNKNGIAAKDKECLSKCTTIQVDMGSYMCPMQCEEFCNTKCKADPYWKKKIKEGRPSVWDFKSEVTTAWTDEEKSKLAESLSQSPESFRSLPLDGIYRMKKSVQIVNPGTTYDNSIAVYDPAFNNPIFSIDHVIYHELAHILYSNMTKSEQKNYADTLGWTKRDLTDQRHGEFIDSAAKDSPEEDFANNIEAYLLDPNSLKNKVPDAYGWISKKYSKKLKLKEKCYNEK